MNSGADKRPVNCPIDLRIVREVEEKYTAQIVARDPDTGAITLGYVEPVDDNRQFTLAQIKAAFWDVFRESGEILCEYLEGYELNIADVDSLWESFCEALEKAKGEASNENKQT